MPVDVSREMAALEKMTLAGIHGFGFSGRNLKK